jgi:hypothetical protein
MDIREHQAFIASLEEEKAGLDAEIKAFLAKVEVRRTALERLIREHKKFVDLLSGAGDVLIDKSQKEPEVIEVVVDSPPIPKNAFKGLSIIEAARKYLGMVKEGKTTRELGEAFIEGGRKAKPDKFYFDSIRTALNRRGKKNGIVKIGDQWWLDEFAPDKPRRVLMSNLFSDSNKDTSTKDVEEDDLSNSKTHILLRAIYQNGKEGATAAEIYENIINAGYEFDKNDVYRILAKQVNRGRVEKKGSKAYLTENGLEAISQEIKSAAASAR